MEGADAQAWLGIELRHLAALHAVAEERSFVRAARRLGYTQSAISNQIAALERIVGTRLVERARGGASVSLTDAGYVVYDHAVALMGRLQAARSDVAAVGAGPAPVLRIGTFQSLGATVLPRIVRRFLELVPGARVELELGDVDRLLEEVVVSGLLDAAFVAAPLRAANVASIPVLEDGFSLLAAAGRGPIDLRAAPMLAYKPCVAQAAHEETLIASRGLPRELIMRVEDAPTIQGLVAAGHANALLPALAVTWPGLAVETLLGARRVIHLVWHADRVPNGLLAQFVAAAKEAGDGGERRRGTIERVAATAA